MFISFRYIAKRIQLLKMAAETEASSMSASKPNDYALNQPVKVKVEVKVKVKFTLEQAMKAQRERRGITILFL